MQNIYFIGIGGTGMSRLALFCRDIGVCVAGSDRSHDRLSEHPLLLRLYDEGIPLYPQDGNALTNSITRAVMSAAIEKNNPDLMKAQSLGIPVITRSQLLAEIFNQHSGIGVTGTSGKTTTTGMISTVLRAIRTPHRFYCGDDLVSELHRDEPSMKETNHIMVSEVDESDGSPVMYFSDIGIITNISFDHKPIPEMMDILNIFARQTRDTLIINTDCPNCTQLPAILDGKKTLGFGIYSKADYNAENICTDNGTISFDCNGQSFKLPVPGIHNVYNALASIAALHSQGYELRDIAYGLSHFKGMKRRLELLSAVDDIRFYDDFAHNPDKIQATINTLKPFSKRLFIIFRPQGYGPMRLFRKSLVDALKVSLRAQDRVYFRDIFDAGGSADRSIHSRDLIADLCEQGIDAHYADPDTDLAESLGAELQPGDTVVVMGARDPYLSAYAQDLASSAMNKRLHI
jgi:UDP-N-acetylmuramate--alanine ligase